MKRVVFSWNWKHTRCFSSSVIDEVNPQLTTPTNITRHLYGKTYANIILYSIQISKQTNWLADTETDRQTHKSNRRTHTYIHEHVLHTCMCGCVGVCVDGWVYLDR